MSVRAQKAKIRIADEGRRTAKIALNCNAGDYRRSILWLERDIERQVNAFVETPAFCEYMRAYSDWDSNRVRYEEGLTSQRPGPEPKPPKPLESVLVCREAIELLKRGYPNVK